MSPSVLTFFAVEAAEDAALEELAAEEAALEELEEELELELELEQPTKETAPKTSEQAATAATTFFAKDDFSMSVLSLLTQKIRIDGTAYRTLMDRL